MFGIGETEFVIILLMAFLLFGPDKLPGMGRTIGRALKQFRTAQEGFTQVVQSEIVDPINDIANADAAKATGVDSDADIDADLDADRPAAGEAPKETFAQRKARMEAEAAAKADDVPAPSAPEAAKAAASSAPAESAKPEPAGPAPAEPAPAKPEAPAAPTAASLYGLDDPAPSTTGEGEEA